MAVAALLMSTALSTDALAAKGGTPGRPGGGETTAGNNLSFPVLWAEGVTKTLRGTSGEVTLGGAWWWWWGMDDNDNPQSCAPDPDDVDYCDDGSAGQAGGDPPGDGAIKAYLQKDLNNTWQAESQIIVPDPEADPVFVDVIDWGDNLESVPWYLTSQVRIETVLYKNVGQMLEYGMRHLYGWGIDEMHGLATDASGSPQAAEIGPGTQATVYSPCARLTIQKLTVPREQITDIVWNPVLAKWTGQVTDEENEEPIFNKAAWEAADGPGYYSAEINVKGMIIFGYTWNVRSANEGPGDYRITFSLDGSCGSATLNTDLTSASILQPEEEVTAADLAATATASAVSVAAEDGGTDGGVAIIDTVNNLTYIDVRILPQRGGGGSGGGGGGGGR